MVGVPASTAPPSECVTPTRHAGARRVARQRVSDASVEDRCCRSRRCGSARRVAPGDAPASARMRAPVAAPIRSVRARRVFREVSWLVSQHTHSRRCLTLAGTLARLATLCPVAVGQGTPVRRAIAPVTASWSASARSRRPSVALRALAPRSQRARKLARGAAPLRIAANTASCRSHKPLYLYGGVLGTVLVAGRARRALLTRDPCSQGQAPARIRPRTRVDRRASLSHPHHASLARARRSPPPARTPCCCPSASLHCEVRGLACTPQPPPQRAPCT